jgi:hypothetical protein
MAKPPKASKRNAFALVWEDMALLAKRLVALEKEKSAQ